MAHRDSVGTLRRETNNGGGTLASPAYDAFGIPTAGDRSDQPFGWKGSWGYEEDPSGFTLVGHRWYDPNVGRFLTRDRIGHGRNWLIYCASNPLRWVDPAGLKPGDPYETMDAAALAALSDITGRSISEGREYAGKIYRVRRPDGTYYYSYTEPRQGEGSSSRASEVPPNAEYVAHYHTHGSFNEMFGQFNTEFSQGTATGDDDIALYHRRGVVGYLGNTSGEYKKYFPRLFLFTFRYGQGPRFVYDKARKLWIPYKV